MTADLHPDTGLPRPGTCCGVCPPIAGGGWDCTCPGLPGCPAARAETTAADRPSVTDNARAEAQRRYQGDWDPYHGEPVDDFGFSEAERRAFVAGAEWAAGRAETTSSAPSTPNEKED